MSEPIRLDHAVDEVLTTLKLAQSSAYKIGFKNAVNTMAELIKSHRPTFCQCSTCKKIDIILDELKEMAAKE